MRPPRTTSSHHAGAIRFLALALLAACAGSEPPPTEPIPAFASIHAASGYTCGLTADGAVWCWGSSGSRFGDGPGGSNLEYTPRPAVGGRSFATLSLGSEHACGIGLDGIAYCWGENGSGALGTGAEIGTAGPSPAAVQGGLHLVQVDAGYLHSCGLTLAGAAYCWGNNDIGQLGTGDQDARQTPAAVVGSPQFRAVSTRRGSDLQVEQNSCGVTPDGAAWCWGGNQGGGLGDGYAETESFVPVAVTGGHTFATLEASGGYACGITPAAELYCWGRGDLEPTLVAGGLQWAKVSLGAGHACGLTTAGLIYCWGVNDYGQVGIGRGTPAFVESPTRLYGVDDVVWRDVSAGVSHTCAIATDGATWCWGFGEQGELGIGDLPAHAWPYLAASPVRTVTSRPVGE